MRGLVCPCMHLLSDWPLSLQLANALVKQSAETIDHRMWQRQGVCVCGGGVEKKKYEAFLGEGEQKCEGRKRDGVRKTG